DYYSRKLFTRYVITKQAKKILKFLRDVYAEFKFKKVISDNGKEFKNQYVSAWLKANGIEHQFISPYHHKSAGRIERVMRTLRTDLNKKKGPVITKLKVVTDEYNNKVHRAIG